MNQLFTRFLGGLIGTLLGFSALAQVETFEDFNLPDESFLDGSMANGGFQTDVAFWPNDFDFGFWLGGWAISTTTDTTDGTFNNLYSAKPGGGNDGSRTYAVGQFASQIILDASLQGQTLQGMYVTNTTYAYEVILQGNDFATAFGGPSGDDPDFFLLTIFGYQNGDLNVTDSVAFFLADYRFPDNSQDYIVDSWEYLDLSPLGPVDSLLLVVTSTDIDPVYGINTPAFFCMDDFNAEPPVAVQEKPQTKSLSLSPTLVTDGTWMDWPPKIEKISGSLQISNLYGQVVQRQNLITGERTWVPTTQLPIGTYFVEVRSENSRWIGTFVKQ